MSSKPTMFVHRSNRRETCRGIGSVQTVRPKKAVGHVAGEFLARGIALQGFRRARASKNHKLARLPLFKERAKRLKIVAERALLWARPDLFQNIGLSRELHG
jgi:hypothetical protein